MIPEQKSISTLLQNGDLLLVQDGNHGGDHPTINDYVMEGGIPLITGANINNGLIDYENSKKISFKKASELKKGIAKTGDILLTHKGTMGKTAMVSKVDFPFIVINPQITIYRVNPSGSLDSRFLKYYFDSPEFQEYFIRISSTSTISTLSLNNQKNLKIPLPHRNIQYCISEFLQKLDEKILLNKKINKTLENIAKTLFKSWFIDFDPVKAKIEGRSTGLPDEMSDLFPDNFATAELDKIPKGWSKTTLSEIAVLNPESWSSKNHPEEIEYLDLSGVKNGKIHETNNYLWSDAPSRAKRILSIGDTIIGTVRPGNRSFCIIQKKNLTGSTGFAALRPKDKINSYLLYLVATSNENIKRLSHLADGGAYPAVKPEKIIETSFVLPNISIQKTFGNLLLPIFDKVFENNLAMENLSNIRNILLPRLITGELKIPDAEQIIEEQGI